MRLGPDLRLAPIVLLLLIGCEPQGEAAFAGVARDSAGVQVVDLPSFSVDEAVTELSIDLSWDPSARLEIGDLVDIDLVPGSGVLLLDDLAGSVTFVSDAGEVLAVIGHEGEGPGEFNPGGPSQVIATDSSVFVPDLFLQRITEFDLEGRVLGIRSFPLSPVYAVDWRMHPNGTLAFRAFERFGDQIIQLVGENADTILTLRDSNDFVNLLLAPVTLWDLTGDGDVFVARTDRAAVELRRGGTGELVWRTQWAHSGIELDETAVAHLKGLVEERILLDTPDISGESLAQNLASIQYPEKAPVVAGLMVAPQGDIWVRLAKPVQAMDTESLRVGSAEAYGGPNWDVLDRQGFLKARVRLPDGFTPRRFYGDWIYGILADELGVETVARIEIRY